MAEEDLLGGMRSGVQLGRQLGMAIGQALNWLMYIFSRPFVLVTQVLFRKEMGECYFDLIQAILSIVLIIAAYHITIFSAGPATIVETQTSYYGVQTRTVPNPEFRAIVGLAVLIELVWIVAFIAATLWHLLVSVPRRYNKGILWHSRSDGVPRLPGLSFPLEMIIVAALTVLAFWFRLYGYGVLLALSLWTSFMSAAYAKMVLFNRVLDAVDAQIESEWLGKAIEKRLTPQKAHGLNAALPAHVTKEYRLKAAQLFEGPQQSQRITDEPATASAPISN